MRALTDRKLNEELKAMRAACGLTQKAFGERFGIPTVTISHWEQGHAIPPAYIVDMMKQILSTDVSETDVFVDPHVHLTRDWDVPVFRGNPRNCSGIAKWYQFPVFYAKELAIWEENPIQDKTGRKLREWLYDNRKFYINKTASELSTKEVLVGLRIAGAVRGYTVFDSSLMQRIFDEYDVTSVYDPCAGWGERMLCSAKNGVAYHGVDINGALFPGYEQMMSDLALSGCSFAVDDSSISLASTTDKTFDALITCPPYGNTEMYSDLGAENLSKEDFLDWWDKEVVQATVLHIPLFAFQINNMWRDDMHGIVIAHGYELCDEFEFVSNKSSHFTRSRGGENRKSSKETMLVYKKAVD